MAMRSLTFSYGRHINHMLEANYSTAQFCCCMNNLAAVVTAERDGKDFLQQKRLHSHVQKRYFMRNSSSAGCSFSFLRFCYRKFHVAPAVYCLNPDSKKVGIKDFEDTDRNSNESTSEPASHDIENKQTADSLDGSNRITGSHGNSDSVVLNTNKIDPYDDNIDPVSMNVPVNNEDEFDNIESVDLPVKEKSKLLPVHNLAALVNQSETLTELVKLGVDLAEVEKVDGAADLVVKLDFEKDVRPYLLFLHGVGVPDDELGRLLSKNPLIFEKGIAELETKIDYLKSKRFTHNAIARIVTKSYVFLVLPVTMIDAKLGFLQKQFELTGEEVRFVVTRLPKLIPWKTERLKEVIFYLKEFLEFTEPEMKKMLLTQPKVFLTNKYSLRKKFSYLNDVMKINHERLVQWPNVFRTRLHLLQQRHGFLASIDRAQYDPEKENYVSLKALVSGKDADFCQNLAKTTLTHYRNFLKTL